MKILHLSDLHLTGENQTFDDVWGGPRAAIGSQRFDVIVVSGDLSQRAAEAEYRALEGFIEAELLPMIGGTHTDAERRRRVVLVPGNHDVDWSRPIGAVFSVTQRAERDGPERVREMIRTARAAPERSVVREIVGPSGLSEFLEIDRARYADRFENVQRHFDRVYADPTPKNDHRFSLTGSEREHWSAHLFPDEGVAFYGFSSCDRNDRYWTGASFSSAAVNAAAQHAKQHAKDLLRVAVWHHGLGSERGRPDGLTLRDIGMLHNAGFRVGLHGHTHAGDGDNLERLLGSGFAIVSTGSLGAHSAERPDAVGNQFSILRLQWSQVDAELWQREGAGGIYSPRRRYFFVVRDARATHVDVTRARRHAREIRVDRSGIVHTDVLLEDVSLRDEIVLGVLSPPFCDAQGDDKARTPEGELTVDERRLPGGARRYALRGDGGDHAKLEWTYRVSNAVALDRAEVDRELTDSDEHTGLATYEECRSHVVRFPCEQLELRVVFDAPDVLALDPVPRVLVEQRLEDHGLVTWRWLPEAAKRCVVAAQRGEVSASIETPLVGCRYSLVFTLAREGLRLGDQEERFAASVLRTCRETHRAGAGFETRLGDEVVRCVEQVLGGALGPRTMIVGLAWSHERKRLFTAFGRFNHPTWNVRFRAGDGVAGHCFRFARPVVWHHRDAGTAKLVYRPETEVQGPYQRRYRWVISVPIMRRDGAALGVVSLANDVEDSDADRKLELLAADPASRGETLQQLYEDLNVVFWTFASRASELLTVDRELARAALETWSPTVGDAR